MRTLTKIAGVGGATCSGPFTIEHHETRRYTILHSFAHRRSSGPSQTTPFEKARRHRATTASAKSLPPNIPKVPGIAKSLYALRLR